MKKYTIGLLCLLAFASHARQKEWPVLKHYEQSFTDRIAMPVGGLGTGNISISGNGQWRDVEIMNRPGMGFFGAYSAKEAPFFMVFTQKQSGQRNSRALMGPVPVHEYPGSEGSAAPNHGLPRFRKVSFDAAYPFGVVNLDDPGMPVSARARVFNPFIPGDADASGLPVAVIRYELTNKTNEPLTVAIAGTMNNFIGMDGFKADFNTWNRAVLPQGANDNKNTFRQSGRLSGIYMTSDSVDVKAGTWGTIALTTPSRDNARISYRTQFNPKGWGADLVDLWDDFSDDGIYRDTTFNVKRDSPRAALSVQFQLQPGQVREIEFLLTWHFPNRLDWNDKEIVGNYYTGKYTDAWDAAEKILPQLPALEDKTIEFVKAFIESDYPASIKEAALFNSSTLRSQTAFRTKDGRLFTWEGVFTALGSCYGSCSHVWNYEHTTPFLFGDLASGMRETEYSFGLWDSTGMLSFRLSLPLNKEKNWKAAAADGQMGTIMKAYREWQLSGDDAFLKRLWPGIRKSLSFAWIPGGWDANKDGVMEGCQHNTMDIEYYGPNPEIQFWYLGALKAASVMAGYLKDKEFEKTCTRLFTQGSQLTDEWLFNGEFYVQRIQPIPDKDLIAPGLLIGMGSSDLKNPDFQIGEGCLVDQLVGQNMAWICGLGYLADPAHIRKAHASIRKYNYLPSVIDHFNNMRSYALGDESGLLLTAYPDPAKRPAIPLSYGFEIWPGLEYTAATGMIYEDMEQEAIKTIDDIRNRFDGRKRNPFNEEECGNHYARSMAAWSAIIAWSRFQYSGVDKRFSITGRPGNYFWSNGYAWGTVKVTADNSIDLQVKQGRLLLRSVEVKDKGTVSLKAPVTLNAGESRSFPVTAKK